MNRLVPVLIVATVLALGATVAGKRICLICKRERDRRRRGAG